MLMELFGGLAVFLFGMDLMTNSLKAAAGNRIKKLLAEMTTNRFKGVLAGAFTTAVIQSSSVTTVLAVGFVAAGLMRLQQSVGIIMGAEIGTTITAQIIAFKVTQFALLFVATGFAMQFLSDNERIKRSGMLILGFGLVFFGMSLMGDATRPLRDYAPFIELLQRMDAPLFGIILSAAFTALIQSSSATTGVIIVLASQGLISLEQGIPLVFGANIGTSITAVLASIGKSRDARRTALVHVLFNVLGVMLWFGFIGPFAEVVRYISPTAPETSGLARLAAETPRQIANAHTLFNVGNTLLFIGFTSYFAHLATLIVRRLPEEEQAEVRPKYLDPVLLETPTLALDRVRMEIGHLAEQVLPMVDKGPAAVMNGNRADIGAVRSMDEDVDRLHNAIVDYLRRLSRQKLTDQQAELLHAYLSIANSYEIMGDTLETNLVHIGLERLDHGVRISPETQQLVEELSEQVFLQVEQATRSVTRTDKEIAALVIAAKPEIKHLINQLERHIMRRLATDAPHRRVTYQIETELFENLKRVYYYTKQVAKKVVESN